MNIARISNYFVDQNNEIINCACNLIMATYLTNKKEVLDSIGKIRFFFEERVTILEKCKKQRLTSKLEVTWIFLMGYTFINMDAQNPLLEVILQRIIYTIKYVV